MDNKQIIKTLIEFFDDAFTADPDGVDEWFAQGGQNLDDFLADLAPFRNQD